MRETKSFRKSSFFGPSGPVKLYLWPNFENRVFPEIPEVIPDFEGTFHQFDLTREMSDSEIQQEQGNPKPFTVAEFAAILVKLLLQQSHGEEGQLLNNGCVNIFHVQLKDGRVVAVGVCWGSAAREWDLLAREVVDVWWCAGFRAFSRSQRRTRRAT